MFPIQINQYRSNFSKVVGASFSNVDQLWVEVGGTKLQTNIKCDFYKLTSIWFMKWTIIFFICDGTKFGLGGFESCPDFWFFGSQLVRKNDITYYGFKYTFLNKQTSRLMKMINILVYKAIQIILGVSRDLF